MAIFAIGDMHLSLGTDKPMDVFPGWEKIFWLFLAVQISAGSFWEKWLC